VHWCADGGADDSSGRVAEAVASENSLYSITALLEVVLVGRTLHVLAQYAAQYSKRIDLRGRVAHLEPGSTLLDAVSTRRIRRGASFDEQVSDFTMACSSNARSRYYPARLAAPDRTSCGTSSRPLPAEEHTLWQALFCGPSQELDLGRDALHEQRPPWRLDEPSKLATLRRCVTCFSSGCTRQAFRRDASVTGREGPLPAVNDGRSLAKTASFYFLGRELGRSVRRSLEAAIRAGAVLAHTGGPLSMFRDALAAAIRDIESHPRGRLFQRFLSIGPFERPGRVPARLRRQRLTDDEVAAVITFIHSHMVNCFKGALAEMLALGPLVRLVSQLRSAGQLPTDARLYVGDAVRVRRKGAVGCLKGADATVLAGIDATRPTSRAAVVGVAEVKSYCCPRQKLGEQLDSHLARVRNGLWVAGVDVPSGRVQVGSSHRPPIRIAVVPSRWLLPRRFRFVSAGRRRLLRVDPPKPPARRDEVVLTEDGMWQVVLGWSSEALAAAAYDMTFLYMGEVGKVVFSGSKPRGLEGMTPERAGRSVATQMLHYAILRSRSRRECGRAVDLYNVYGFGYALGMNFRNAHGQRQVLFFRDLDEILATGRTSEGCVIHGYSPDIVGGRVRGRGGARRPGALPF
jgi:hypothetical protein